MPEQHARDLRTPAHLFTICQQLNGSAEQRSEASQWASDMQAQCFELISQLYAEDNAEHLPLIGFLSGVGECCSEIQQAAIPEQSRP